MMISKKAAKDQKSAETRSQQDSQVVEKLTSDSSNITQASPENISEHVVQESSPVSKTVPKITEVMPHPDRVLQESSASIDNENL